MSNLALRFLGRYQVSRDGQPITRFESNKVRALLAYLAVEADEPHSREELVGLLWPDRPEAMARADLRQAVANLRQSLGDRSADPPFLIITGDTIQFNRECDHQLDVAVFEEQWKACAAHRHRQTEACRWCAQHLQAAVDVYGGDFLARFSRSSSAFEEWTLLKRERWHHAALDAMYCLAEHHARRLDHDQAWHYARRQLELDPWREEAHRQAMRALALKGQRSAALAQYETCRRILAADLDVAPAAATTDLFEQIKSEQLTSSEDSAALPAPSTPLIGRERELSEIDRLVTGALCRVVTLVGLGGVGKTQLAVQAAAAQKGVFAHGIHFVPLAGIASAIMLAATIAVVLGVVLDGASDPLKELAAYLARREMLIVLDSFEQLSAAGAVALAALIVRAPRVIFLVTSRERLNLRDEWVIPVHGLNVPADDRATDVASYDAVQMFVSRAERVGGHTAWSPDNWLHAARICRLVAGLPLAIELAASRSSHRSFAQIADEIERSFDFVAAPLPDVPQRHRSLRAVFEQSWQLLSPVERTILQELAVFRGGFDVAAAEYVVGSAATHLDALVDKSLLQRVDDGRLVVPEIIRQYAEEQLRLAGAADRVGARHSAYFCARVSLAEARLTGADQVLWLSRLDADLDNLRAALEWSLTAQPEVALEISGKLWRYWQMRGYLVEGRRWLEQALNATGDEKHTRSRAQALNGAANLAGLQGDHAVAHQWAEQSVLLWRSLTDGQGLANALIALGIAAGHLGDHAGAAAALEESVALFRTTHDRWGLALALYYLADSEIVPQKQATVPALLFECLALFEAAADHWGMALAMYGCGVWKYRGEDYAAARAWLERALAECHAIGDRCLMAEVLNTLGDVACGENCFLDAERLYADSLALYRAMGLRSREATLLHLLGLVKLRQSDPPHADQFFMDSFALFRQLDANWGIAACLEGLASVDVLRGNYADAVLLFGLADRIRATHRVVTSPPDQREPDRYRAIAKSQMDAARFAETWAAGYAMAVEEMHASRLKR